MLTHQELGVLPDEALVRRAQGPAGEDARRAAGELLGRHRLRVYSWCRRFVRDHERAMDLAQDVMLNALRGLPAYQSRAPFRAWLFAIARHACIRAMRPVSLSRDEEAEPEALADPGAGPEERVEDELQEEAMLDLMRRRLEPRERQALWLRCVDRMPVEEITRVLGLDNRTGARGLLQTARRKLRSALAGDAAPWEGIP